MNVFIEPRPKAEFILLALVLTAAMSACAFLYGLDNGARNAVLVMAKLEHRQ